MKKFSLIITTILFLCICLNCNDNDTSIDNGETSQEIVIEDINISANNYEYLSEISDFDIEGKYLYFDYHTSIYRVDLSVQNPIPELVIEDAQEPNISSLTVINNTLYYQSFWVSSSNIKKVDLNNISAGTINLEIPETPRGQLIKNMDDLIYLATTNVFSATTNFYQLNDSGIDEKIISDQAEYPYYDNLKFVDDYLYFTAENEVRRIDLNNPTQEASIIFTASGLADDANGEIIGFDIQDDMIYFSRNSTNQLFSANLNTPNEAPEVISTNTNLLTSEAGYTELIINNGYLYAKKTAEDTIAVIKI